MTKNLSGISLATPVLFMVYNRPDTTMQVFEVIRSAKPARLYLASDGARLFKEGEAELVEEIREYILSRIDWECEVKTLFRDKNLGCRNAINSAIDWFFENEEMGIILEDDCLPSQSFFRYCGCLLEKYKNDTRIMCISGTNYFPGKSRPDYSYFFFETPLIWGWATWRRAWGLNAKVVENFYALKPSGIPLTPGKLGNRMWWDKVGKTAENKIDTWDYLWVFTNLINSGLTIIPRDNLVKNIGIGHANSTHTSKLIKNQVVESKELPFPLNHPPFVRTDYRYDKIIYAKIFNANPKWKKALRLICDLFR